MRNKSTWQTFGMFQEHSRDEPEAFGCVISFSMHLSYMPEQHCQTCLCFHLNKFISLTGALSAHAFKFVRVASDDLASDPGGVY